MGIFNIDNKFFRALNKLVDMVILSFCWIISCIPVFTIGAASTALYDTSRRVIHRDEGYLLGSPSDHARTRTPGAGRCRFLRNQ